MADYSTNCNYDNCNSMLKLLCEHASHEYSSFTQLQMNAFSSSEIYDNKKNIFVIGETSAGKTLIPLLLYYAAVKEANAAGRSLPKMLFVVPYRALAAQKEKEIRDFFKNENLIIAQSTGEYRQSDEAVQSGDVHIAIIITEKVYKYEARNSAFLSQYDYLVLDEVGLLDNMERGVRLDFIFAWARNQQILTGKPRMIALGTPFYNWDAYIESYGFFLEKSNCRPVRLESKDITISAHVYTQRSKDGTAEKAVRMVSEKDIIKLTEKYGVASTTCYEIEGRCLFDEPARTNSAVKCPATKKPCIYPIEYVSSEYSKRNHVLLKICREHLLKEHQILVFINNREMAKEICLLLYRNLKDILPVSPSAEECRQKILSECGLDSEDVFGVLEDDRKNDEELELYQSFVSGIGFHNAALPNELRTYVENNILNGRNMKIVCSTETLAFGVNSSVDVVIILDIFKQENGANRRLSLNEYQNYAGRAGRLQPGQMPEDAVGYVYTLVNDNQRKDLELINAEAYEIKSMFSRFYQDSGQRISFFLLNLLPTCDNEAITVDQLVKSAMELPQDGSYDFDTVTKNIKAALRFLIEQDLAFEKKPSARERRNGTGETHFFLTEKGQKLRGYILDNEDYLKLLEALEQYLNSLFDVPDKVTFLYKLLETKHAESGLNNIFASSESRLGIDELCKFIIEQAHRPYEELSWLKKCKNDRILSILAAILSWCNATSPKTLYRKFGIHYALLIKVAEQVAYLIEIAAELLPFQMDKIWKEREKNYLQVKASSEYMEGLISAFKKQIEYNGKATHNLFISVYFGINIDVAEALIEYLKKGKSEAQAIAEKLSLDRINPESAREIRRITVRYLFFKEPMQNGFTSLELRNNYYNQREQYKNDVLNMKKPITDFFIDTLGDLFNL